MRSVRRPAVAGLFYPGDPRVLAETVDSFLAAGAPLEAIPKALVAPHAGYVYSGGIAGLAYATLAPARDRITRVVLLGPVHRVPVRGLALPGCAALATPLGEIPVDAAAAAGLDRVVTRPDVHAEEHSLEVQLPFLQRALGDFAVVPLAVGDASAGEVAAVLDALWGGPETLIVVSSDLSHYHPYAVAKARDAATIEAVLDLAGPIAHQQACGATPLNGLLAAAPRHGLTPVLLGACNSGDTAGDRGRVVGYASFAFVEES
nr:AmmeMemoRadiSam system protein B [Propionibacterium sp.]